MFDGNRHGRGIERYENEEVFDGYWLNNLRNGRGKMNFTNGDFYEGAVFKYNLFCLYYLDDKLFIKLSRVEIIIF